MDAYIGLIPGLPFLSFLIIVFFGRMLSRRAVAITAVGSVCLSAALTIFSGISFLSSNPAENRGHVHPVYLDEHRWIYCRNNP